MKNYEPLVVRMLVARETDLAQGLVLPQECRWKEVPKKTLDHCGDGNGSPLKDSSIICCSLYVHHLL